MSGMLGELKLRNLGSRAILAALLGVICLALGLAGCLAGPGPVEQTLRVSPPVGACDGAAAEAVNGAKLLALRSMDCLPGLERTAVLFNRNGVLSASGAWYWEGTPCQIVEQNLKLSLACRSRFRLTGTFLPRGSQTAALRVTVVAFEVLPAIRHMHVQLVVSLWGPQGTEFLAERSFDASVELSAVTPEGVAAGANQAVDQVLGQVAAWLGTII